MDKKILRKRFEDRFLDIFNYMHSDEAFEYFLNCMKRESSHIRAKVMWVYFNESMDCLFEDELEELNDE